jgi:hypothetical protein
MSRGIRQANRFTIPTLAEAGAGGTASNDLRDCDEFPKTADVVIRLQDSAVAVDDPAAVNERAYSSTIERTSR